MTFRVILGVFGISLVALGRLFGTFWGNFGILGFPLGSLWAPFGTLCWYLGAQMHAVGAHVPPVLKMGSGTGPPKVEHMR